MMQSYQFNSSIEQNNQFKQITIIFTHYWSENIEDWEDPTFGSIRIDNILESSNKIPVNNIPIINLIYLKRDCWKYLFNTKYSNVSHLDQYMPLNKHHKQKSYPSIPTADVIDFPS